MGAKQIILQHHRLSYPWRRCIKLWSMNSKTREFLQCLFLPDLLTPTHYYPLPFLVIMEWFHREGQPLLMFLTIPKSVTITLLGMRHQLYNSLKRKILLTSAVNTVMQQSLMMTQTFFSVFMTIRSYSMDIVQILLLILVIILEKTSRIFPQ